jgi:hypothetical protein
VTGLQTAMARSAGANVAGKPLSLLVLSSGCIICLIQAIWANIASVKLHCITRRPDRAAGAR